MAEWRCKPTTDLNAMAEAEGTLSDPKLDTYVMNLAELTGCDNLWAREGAPACCYRDLVRATARQRAIAFILTKEKS